MRRKLLVSPLVGALLVSMMLTASAAAAPGSGCGMVITQSMTLTADIGPCARGGIIIAANDVRVDLGGHTISGKGTTGDGAGVLFNGTTGSWVLNGTVTGFDAGVAIVGGGRNTVWSLTIRDNIGSLKAARPAYGDGVAISSSGGNWITRSTIVNNGPFGGISVFGDGVAPEDVNVIERNRIVDNDVARATTNEDSGIRLDGPGVAGAYIRQNTIIGNGLDGISVAAAPPGIAWSVYILENVIAGNGFHAMGNRKGDGIVLSAGADLSLVNDNDVTGNAANGIRVGSRTSRVIFNTVTGNVAYPGVTGAFDLNEENADCADNEWTENVFETASLPCVD